MSVVKKILVVEDSPIVTKIIRHVIKGEAGIEAHYAASFAAWSPLRWSAATPNNTHTNSNKFTMVSNTNNTNSSLSI